MFCEQIFLVATQTAIIVIFVSKTAISLQKRRRRLRTPTAEWRACILRRRILLKRKGHITCQ